MHNKIERCAARAARVILERVENIRQNGIFTGIKKTLKLKF